MCNWGGFVFGSGYMRPLLNQADYDKSNWRQKTEFESEKGKSQGNITLTIFCTSDWALIMHSDVFHVVLYVWRCLDKILFFHYQMLKTKFWQLSFDWLSGKSLMLWHMFRHLQMR